MIVCLIGRSGAGKSSVARYLAQLGFKRLKSWTTREHRPGDETDELIFSNKNEMETLNSAKFFLEMSEYQGNLYATENIDINSKDNYVKAIEKNGYLEIERKMRDIGGPDVISIYLDISRETSINRLKLRQANMDDWIAKRVSKDDNIYNVKDICYTHIIDAEQSLCDVCTEVKRVLEQYKE